MAQTDVERLSRLMLDEFKSVQERFDRQDDRFDKHDQRFDNIDRELHGIRAGIKSIRIDLDELTEKVDNILGYRKEIDHALERIAAIEKHLGINKKVAAPS